MPKYIDAEKIEYDEHKRIGLGIDYGINESDTYYTTTKEKIDAMPTADVRENVHAHWLKEEYFGGIFKCSNCGKYIDFKGLKGTPDPTNFCPYCGAEMAREA